VAALRACLQTSHRNLLVTARHGRDNTAGSAAAVGSGTMLLAAVACRHEAGYEYPAAGGLSVQSKMAYTNREAAGDTLSNAPHIPGERLSAGAEFAKRHETSVCVSQEVVRGA
jgi:hypothetical protein